MLKCIKLHRKLLTLMFAMLHHEAGAWTGSGRGVTQEGERSMLKNGMVQCRGVWKRITRFFRYSYGNMIFNIIDKKVI